ncbi:MAG: hypothetical protein AB1772_00700 [Candidatus Zixiibacteriota bacterium]
MWFLLDACLAVCMSCLLKDNANPLALVLVDGPSTEKTTVLDFFDGLPYCYRLDKFTPASFLTQSGNVKKKDLKNVDLLAKIPYKTVIIPDMSTLFNQPKEILQENYATLARVLDGNGLSNAGAVHGSRSLTGDYIFGLLGATTPISQTAWNAMSRVGSRLLFLNAPARLSREERQSRAKTILTEPMHYKQKKRRAKEAVAQFLSIVIKQYRAEPYEQPEGAPENLNSVEALLKHCGYLPRTVKWDPSQDCPESIDLISLLADFVTTGRQDIRVWTERGEDGHAETNSTGAVPEGVDRFTTLVCNLARSHALISGRKQITTEDLPLIVAVSLSCLPDDRRKAVELVFDQDIPCKQSKPSEFTVTELMKYMKVSDKTAKQIMKKLELIGLGLVEEGVGRIVSRFTLNPDFNWLISDKFLGYYRSWEKEPDKSDSGDIPF